MPRISRIERRTNETNIVLEINLDGQGCGQVRTGVGFFDHMLDLFARHSCCDLAVAADGDLQIDAHHTVEDVGICLGRAIREALGDKAGIRRYGHFTLPMDETLVTAAVDFSGRYAFAFQAPFSSPRVGSFDTELVEHFWQSVAAAAMCNLHVLCHYGRNNHHIAEAIFKGLARSIRMAVEADGRLSGVPSTKGALDG